jgi:DNA-binding beta-propeller fold protein YncE/mono/diheme cytochrome c family protein
VKQSFAAALALLTAGLACEPAPRTIEAGRGPVSGALAVTRDNSRILVADEDRDQLLILDRASKQITGRVALGDGPAHVIELSDGSAAVTTRYGNSIAIVDVKNAALTKTIAVGTEPFGLVEVKEGLVAVVLAGDASVALVDTGTGTSTKSFALTDPDPRAVALLADGSLYVSHMATGAFSRVRLDTNAVTRVEVATRNDFGPRIIPEHLRSLTLDPDRGTVLVTHSQANSDTVRAPIGDGGDFGGGSCGYSGCVQELGAVVPGITEVDPDSNTVVTPAPDQGGAIAGAPGMMEMDCFDCGFSSFSPNPPSVLNPFEQRFSGTSIANPVALALFDGGRGQIIVNLSSKNALLLKRDLKGVAKDVIATVKLGNGASAIALSQDGAIAYVWNQFDMTLSQIELPQVDDAIDTAARFVPDANGQPVASAELGVVPELAATIIPLGLVDSLSVSASMGRKLFHDATNSAISANSTVSCASCHPDGRTDGRTWQFVFGPRNTPQLGGDILDTAPFHWPGDVPTVADLNAMTVLPFMGGTGLDAGSFEYIAQFIGTIRAAPSAAAVRGLNDAELRGEEIFFSEAAACATCHAGEHFTNNVAYDVGTRASDMDIAVFQTPVLHGLGRSAPFLHDGSQRSLEDLVNNIVRSGLMGNPGRTMTDAQASDLVAYLNTL